MKSEELGQRIAWDINADWYGPGDNQTCTPIPRSITEVSQVVYYRKSFDSSDVE
jgi:hypothetical protein